MVSDRPGSKGEARNAKSPGEAWSCLIDNNILDNIVECTNIYISSVKDNFNRECDALPTNRGEIKALFGLLYFARMMKSNRLNIKDIWATDGSRISLFPTTMGQNRFLFLLRCLRFDNINTRQSRK